MMSEPRIMPLARASTESNRSTRWVRAPSAAAGAASSLHRTSVLERLLVDTERLAPVGRLVDRLVGQLADLVGLVDHALRRRHEHTDGEGEQAEHDESRRQASA